MSLLRMPDSLRATSIHPQRRRRCNRTRHAEAAASLCVAGLQCSKRAVAQPIETVDSYVVAVHNGIFINTGLQPGAMPQHKQNRFNGFTRKKAVETARVSGMPCTRL